MINSMDMVWNLGQMVPNMKAIILMEKKREEESLLLLMEVIMKVNLSKMKYVGMENITGQMESNMKANGVITKCMVKVY
jgi:hypothetical protein